MKMEKVVLVKVTKTEISTSKVLRSDYPSMNLFTEIEASHSVYSSPAYSSEIFARAELFIKDCSGSTRNGHILLLCTPKAYKGALRAIWGYASWKPVKEQEDVQKRIASLERRLKLQSSFLFKVSDTLLPMVADK